MIRRAPLLILAAVLSASSITVIVNDAGASSHPNYPLNNARFCKPHYVKKVVRSVVAQRVDVNGKREVKNKVEHHIECVYVASVTTTTATPVTTTTEVQIYDQATSIDYFAFGSYNVTIGNLVNATEYADLTITGLPLSPGGGTVSFYDEFGNFICTGTVDTNEFQTVTGCIGVGLASAPATPISAVYSGTQFGYNDGHGTFYAGSSAQGTPG